MIPARRCGNRRPVLRTTAPPWEKPASTMRSEATPRSVSHWISARTACSDSRIPASSSRRPNSVSAMSYQARMTYPRLIVTGRCGAWGKRKGIARSEGSRSSGTMGTKSRPSAPNPCSQITLAVGCGAVSISIGGVGGTERVTEEEALFQAAGFKPLAQFIVLADVFAVDEDLRHRPFARLLDHDVAHLGRPGDVDLLVGNALLIQQGLRDAAVVAIVGRVNLNARHSGHRTTPLWPPPPRTRPMSWN